MSPESCQEYACPRGDEPRPGINDVVSRVQGPSAEGPRYRWKPRLSSSDPVCHWRSTARSLAVAVKVISFTAVGTAAHAVLNSDVLPGVVQATVPSRHCVVVAEITSPVTPGKLCV